MHNTENQDDKKTILAKVDGFTPLIDALVAQCGVIRAAVFGKVWRYCQMENGVCEASQERIAKELGLSRVTVNQHIDKLCQDGYLKDITPDLVGMPHKYADTGKAGVSICFTGNAEPVKQIDTPCKANLHPPVKKIYTKKVVKKDNKPREKKNIDPIEHALSFAELSKKAKLAIEIESAVKVHLGMEATSTKNGMKFVETAIKKHLAGEDYQVFIDWYSRNVEKKYRSFNSMIERWPMAFSGNGEKPVVKYFERENDSFVPAP